MNKRVLSNEQMSRLTKLAEMPDDKIDLVDIPEAPEENWQYARHGNLYRPVKLPVTIRLDADVLSWFKEHATTVGYQTEINRVLRHHMAEAEKRRA